MDKNIKKEHMESISTPVILLVSERSGSNLLRSLIGKHSLISAPVAPHLLEEFYANRIYYGDLRIRKNMINLLEDMLLLVNHPYHDWNINVSAHELVNNYKVSSIITAFDALYREKAKKKKKRNYCSKGINSVTYIDNLRGELPHAKFIHLVRDPRDHVLSWMKMPINLLTPYDTIKKWVKEQKATIDAIKTRGLKCHIVRYEDLIEDPKREMSKVLEYIGVNVEEECFSTNRNNKESNRNPYWRNLSKPIMKNNKNKFRDGLVEQDINMIETVAYDEMKFYGYELTGNGDWVMPLNYEKEIERERKMKSKELKRDDSHKMLELKSKVELLKEIRERRVNEQINNSHHVLKETDLRGTNKLDKIFGECKRRMKYLLYGIVGKKLTDFLVKSLK